MLIPVAVEVFGLDTDSLDQLRICVGICQLQIAAASFLDLRVLQQLAWRISQRFWATSLAGYNL